MNAITEYLGLTSYRQMSEDQKVKFLDEQLASKRPLLPTAFVQEAKDPKAKSTLLTPEVREVLATFAVLAELPPRSLGAYCISDARAASDVLCVAVLQREFGMSKPMRIAPIFESLDDLFAAPNTLRRLLQCSEYRRQFLATNVQDIMLGYSDSSKDAGRFASAWGLYQAQENLVSAASEVGVELIFFHGRGGTAARGGGGTVGRGREGGPIHMVIKAQPGGTVQKGRMRVTVQGAVIDRQFGTSFKTTRTLDSYVSAMLEAELREQIAVKPNWRQLMDEMATESCAAYKKTVFRDPRFFAYFRDITPNAELGRANIGSRPLGGKSIDSVAAVRAIPFVFGWMQTRVNLPVWLGVGEALKQVTQDPLKLATVKEMYQNFPRFQSLVNLVGTSMDKADPNIMELYETGLTSSGELRDLGKDLRQRLSETKMLVRSLTAAGAESSQKAPETSGHTDIEPRKALVMPLNVMQG